MARYKKPKTDIAEIEISVDQIAVQNEDGDVIVIARANAEDHKRLGWIPVEQ